MKVSIDGSGNRRLQRIRSQQGASTRIEAPGLRIINTWSTNGERFESVRKEEGGHGERNKKGKGDKKKGKVAWNLDGEGGGWGLSPGGGKDDIDNR